MATADLRARAMRELMTDACHWADGCQQGVEGTRAFGLLADGP